MSRMNGKKTHTHSLHTSVHTYTNQSPGIRFLHLTGIKGYQVSAAKEGQKKKERHQGEHRVQDHAKLRVEERGQSTRSEHRSGGFV